MDPEAVPAEALPEGLDVVSLLSTVLGDPWIVSTILALVGLMITLQLIACGLDVLWTRLGLVEDLTVFGYIDDPKEQRREARKHRKPDRRSTGYHAFMRDELSGSFEGRPRRRRRRKTKLRGQHHHTI